MIFRIHLVYTAGARNEETFDETCGDGLSEQLHCYKFARLKPGNPFGNQEQALCACHFIQPAHTLRRAKADFTETL